MTDPIELLRELYPKLDNGYKSKVEQAVNSIKDIQLELADLKSTLDRQPLPEAPASITVKVVDPASQFEYLVTVREARAGLALIGHIPDISAALAGLGLVAMDAYIDGRRAERVKDLPAPAMVTTQPKQAPVVGSDYTFNAETLTKSTDGDKTYYKVKGGQFTQFGVTIWPEALQAAGFDLDTLTGVTNLSGYTAYYVLNDKGKPAKVVGLARG